MNYLMRRRTIKTPPAVFGFVLILFGFVGPSLLAQDRLANRKEIVVALSSRVRGLNSLTDTSSDSTVEALRPLVFNSLTRRMETDLSIGGELAKEIITSTDRMSISFILRDNVKFHDGRGLTADDVKYTLETLFETAGYKAAPFFESKQRKDSFENVRLISRIIVEGPYKITLHIIRPNVGNQILIYLASIPIVQRGSISPGQDLRIGTGPFRVVRLDTEKGEIVLETNPLYWDGKPSPKTLRFKTIFDVEQLQAELRSGDVDLFRSDRAMTPSEREKLEGVDGAQVHIGNGKNIQYIAFNANARPLTDTRIRKAIAYGIDRLTLIREKLDGAALPAYSILPPSSWAYSTGEKYDHDVARARDLVRSSKYKGQSIVIQIGAGNSQLFSVAESIRDSLRHIGLNVEIEVMEVNSVRANLMLGHFQMFIGTWIGGNQDPLFLEDLFHSRKIPNTGFGVACCNRSRYSNPRVDSLLESARNQSDLQIAAAQYKEAWEIISSDLPIIPLWYPAEIILHNRRIQINSKATSGLDFLKTVTLRE